MEDNEQLPEPGPGKTPLGKSILRLIVGGVLEGSSLLTHELSQWEATHPENPEIIEEEIDPYSLNSTQLRHAAIGLVFRSAQTVVQGASAAAYGAGSLTRKVLSPLSPILNNPISRSTEQGYSSLVSRGEEEINGVVRLGQIEEERSRQMAKDIFNGVVEQVVQSLSNSPQVNVLIQTQINQLASPEANSAQLDALVEKLAGNYINYLTEHPEQVRALIRDQGDEYIGYLHENPEQVQDLIQGQSLSLTAEILDEVRERMVTGDSLLEMLARRLFRRGPRSELPGPPAQVRARAGVARLPGDFWRLEGSGNEQ